eukprot:8249089-Heterocapsa_arctica.AAC.1
MATNEQYKQSLIKQIAMHSGMNVSDLSSETDTILRQERIHSLLNNPSDFRSQDGSVFDFRSQGSSPIVDIAREQAADSLLSGHYELDVAE